MVTAFGGASSLAQTHRIPGCPTDTSYVNYGAQSTRRLRQLFPRDCEQQDLYFDDLSTGRSSAEEKGEGFASPPAPAGSGPGA